MPFPDYEEFIASLNENRVRYLIIGAQALAYHARPRATKDLDIYVERGRSNAKRLLAAIQQFLGTSIEYSIEDLMDPRTIIQIGVAPVRIDLLMDLPGIGDFAEAWKNHVEVDFGSVRTYVIGLDQLITAKQATDRVQDRADVRALKRAKARLSAQPPSRRNR